MQQKVTCEKTYLFYVHVYVTIVVLWPLWPNSCHGNTSSILLIEIQTVQRYHCGNWLKYEHQSWSKLEEEKNSHGYRAKFDDMVLMMQPW